MNKELDLEKLREVRAFLLPRWRIYAEDHGIERPELGQGLAAMTSAFLAPILGPGWRVEGGNTGFFCFSAMSFVEYARGGGFLGFDESWHNHFWVSDGERIVDLTAAQFGDREVVVCARDDPRYRANLRGPYLERVLRDAQIMAREWLNDWDRAIRARQRIKNKEAAKNLVPLAA